MTTDGDLLGMCYVCMDESSPAPRSQCECRNMFLHRKCHLQMLRHQRDATRCSICNSYYKNVLILHLECGVCVLVVWICISILLYTGLHRVDDASTLTSAAAACYFAAYILVLVYFMWANIVCPICAQGMVMRLV